MKKLFIYYSLTGNGDLVAEYLKEKEYDIRKIETKEPLPKNYVLRILTGGYKAMINYKDKLIDFDVNIDEYDKIVIGSPVWNARLSSPINTVLKLLDLKDKKVKFILYAGSGQAPKAKEYIEKNYSQANMVILKEPLKNKEELEKLN